MKGSITLICGLFLVAVGPAVMAQTVNLDMDPSTTDVDPSAAVSAGS